MEKEPYLFFQAIDYWSQLRVHPGGRDLQKSGYFPGVSVNGEDPWLYLVSTVLEYHPWLGLLKLYIGADLEVHCVGTQTQIGGQAWK